MKGASGIPRGGAGLALPLLLVWALASNAGAAGFPQAGQTASADLRPQLDATAMYLMARPDALDEAPKALGFPATGAQFLLYGGGASFGKGDLRLGVEALAGGLSARDGGLNTEWRLRLGDLLLEQRYPTGPVEITAGALFTYAQTEGFLEDGLKQTRFDGLGYGGGVVSGVRWPRDTPLGFLVRAGYLWLPVNGSWKGDLQSVSPKASLDLGGPIAQAQVELGF